jgi:Na+:H+ antiporter, NhaA family
MTGIMQKSPAMYRVSPALNRFATALLLGAVLATAWVNFSPASYYDFAERRLLDLTFAHGLMAQHLRVTPVSLVGEALMALFVALIAKELWEAAVMERGPLAGARMIAPLVLLAGCCLGAALVWTGLVLGFGVAEDFDQAGGWGLGWSAPVGSDVVLCYLFGRLIFGVTHPALKLLLVISIAETLIGLLCAGLFAGQSGVRLFWLLVPFGVALLVWWHFGLRPAGPASERRAQRANAIWPYAVAGLVSWSAVLAAGLPGALGLLPVLPAVAHADRSFGLFAEAEGLLHDPLNRIAHLLIWPVTGTMFAFGLTFGAIDFAAFGALTVIMLAALWIGKPLGLFAMAFAVRRFGGSGALMGLSWRDFACIAPLLALAFTGPALGLSRTLPQGVMADAARLGLALSVLAGPVCVVIVRRWR